jgi:hypothetical protein
VSSGQHSALGRQKANCKHRAPSTEQVVCGVWAIPGVQLLLFLGAGGGGGEARLATKPGEASIFCEV